MAIFEGKSPKNIRSKIFQVNGFTLTGATKIAKRDFGDLFIESHRDHKEGTFVITIQNYQLRKDYDEATIKAIDKDVQEWSSYYWFKVHLK